MNERAPAAILLAMAWTFVAGCSAPASSKAQAEATDAGAQVGLELGVEARANTEAVVIAGDVAALIARLPDPEAHAELLAQTEPPIAPLIGQLVAQRRTPGTAARRAAITKVLCALPDQAPSATATNVGNALQDTDVAVVEAGCECLAGLDLDAEAREGLTNRIAGLTEALREGPACAALIASLGEQPASTDGPDGPSYAFVPTLLTAVATNARAKMVSSFSAKGRDWLASGTCGTVTGTLAFLAPTGLTLVEHERLADGNWKSTFDVAPNPAEDRRVVITHEHGLTEDITLVGSGWDSVQADARAARGATLKIADQWRYSNKDEQVLAEGKIASADTMSFAIGGLSVDAAGKLSLDYELRVSDGEGKVLFESHREAVTAPSPLGIYVVSFPMLVPGAAPKVDISITDVRTQTKFAHSVALPSLQDLAAEIVRERKAANSGIAEGVAAQ